MAKPRKIKDLAQRIDPAYFRRPHRLRRARFLLSAGLALLGGLWVASAHARGRQGIFSNGPLSSSHALIESQCGKCHVERFGPVRDSACLACHVAGAHVPAGKGHDPACGSCHRDHRGRDRLDRVADGHCNACHERHKGITGMRDHIEFAPAPYDQRIRFNHDRHLRPDLLEGPLDCGSCHVPEGSSFRRIAFGEHCIRCHTERLEAEVSEESVPHGVQPGPLRDWVRAVYLRRMRADPALLRETSRDRSVPPEWAEAVEARAAAAMGALLQPGRGCLLCHVAEGDRVLPPRIPARWLGEARFNHKTHRFESCAKCHNMSLNTAAEQLTLPGIATCGECHRKDGARTSCVTCHDYHPLRQPEAWR